MNFNKILSIMTLFIFMIQVMINIECDATEIQNTEIVPNSELVNNNDELTGLENNVDENNQMKIYSEAAILIEAKTGKILYEKEIYTRKYPASTTKILTAIIALEECDLNEKAIASSEAVHSIKSGYTIANIQVGESFTIAELLDVLMLQSANEAANVIAEHISGSVEQFSKLMNEKAKSIGCLDSNFVNPNGVHDENHYSTAYDLAMIAKYCMQNQKFREIVTKMECSLPTTEIWQEERIFRNTNSLLKPDHRYYYQYCNGIKTGFTTPAKNCLISSSDKDGFEVISVILHAEATEEGLSARYLDTINLFEYGYNNYNLDEILEEYDMINYSANVEQENITNVEQENISNIEQENISNIEQENFNNIKQSNIENNVIINDLQEEYKTEINEETVLASGVVDNINLDKSFEYKAWMKIITGLIIILGIMMYYIIKRIKKNRAILKEHLYSFKLHG